MDVVYPGGVPKLWNETIEEHRRAVHDAALDTTAALVAEHGLASVTMSRIAAETGIGRATLYKYFPDVEAILAAWHARHVARHLEHLAAVRDQADADPAGRLEAVLTAYALITYQRPQGTEIASLVHRGEHMAQAEQLLLGFVSDLIAGAAQAGELRDDAEPGELASYCLHALNAAGRLPSEAAVRRLVAITMAGLRPPA
jgi:AcrR family transcriptional regulator